MAAAPHMTHCKRGHAFTPENTIQLKRQRLCRVCRLERQAQWRKANRAYANAHQRAWRAKSGHKMKEYNRRRVATIQQSPELQQRRREHARAMYQRKRSHYLSKQKHNSDRLLPSLVVNRLTRSLPRTEAMVLRRALKDPKNVWLIDLKRAALRFKRLIVQMEHGTQ